ncbi:F-box protein At5g03970-like [Papaver somniferum]|uniref:F-box protein At5g03970-like n=1 Tax=Papaver somniferum TaxID=3469 RepID=UPI000E6FB6CB|nr:F-box protein At5g03970-like [Papaver somniferum]XP_026431271.1 F-box protein At5g03970-like [Papaver somniferum]XP_026431272.1 F-box protein At5g03970-like [Papaver somniferum]XP_026431274.1 F-box protein At5g03970-like [Papaver somniferum]XP_026431275.1 F-box protein At5g03970-like [Papaver somniferum]
MLIHIYKQKAFRKLSIAYLGDSHSQLISKFSFEFVPNSNSSESTLYLLGSSNGLILCSKNTTHFVCNPLTEKWIQLPPTPHQFDIEKHETLTGFECDCSALPTRFKVVRITSWQEEVNKFNIQVFSSDLGRWSFYEVFCPVGETLTFPVYGSLRFPPRGADRLPTDAVIIHRNVLYWMGWYGRIVVYNLDEMNCEFRLIELPDRGVCFTRCLGVSNGSIFYARLKRTEETLCVFVLQEGNFHLLHGSIDLHDLFAEMNTKLTANLGIRWADLIKVFGFNPVDSNVVTIGCRNYIWAYNIETRKYDELCHPSSPGNEHSAADFVYLPLLLKPMPTVLPPRSCLALTMHFYIVILRKSYMAQPSGFIYPGMYVNCISPFMDLSKL